MVSAPAAVGKTTFARWLADTTNAHFVDLSALNVGSHGFVGNLAAHSLQDQFGRGDLTIVIDALDEGLVRSGFGNYEAFFQDLASIVNSVSSAWDADATRVVLLGRPDAADLTRLVLADSGISFTDVRLDHMNKQQAAALVIAHTPQHAVEPTRRAVEAFFSAAARALQLDDDDLWSSPLGRGFAGYAPVLRAVAEVTAANPAAASAQWERPTEWGSAWQLLAETAEHLLLRERTKLVDALGSEVPANAYGGAQQLELLAARLRDERVDPCVGLNFDTPASEAAFREAVELHLPEHPFLAEGASEVFGSMVAAVEIARGGQMVGAESRLGPFSRWPFMWRFFADHVRRNGNAVVDGSSVGWVLASLWNGVEDPARVTARHTERDGMSVDVVEASGAALQVGLVGEVVLRGIARNLSVEAPEARVRLGQRDGGDGSVFVMRETCSIRAADLVVDPTEVLIESDSVVVLDVDRCDSPVQRVTCRPGAALRVSRSIFRHPWTAVAETIPREIGGDLPLAVTEFLDRASRALPESSAGLVGRTRPSSTRTRATRPNRRSPQRLTASDGPPSLA